MKAEKALLTLELARAEHERIAQAVAQDPKDYATRKSLTRAVAAGRAAWRWYQASGPEQPIRGPVPAEFMN